MWNTFVRTRDGQDSGGLKRERCESREFTVEVVLVFSLAFFFFRETKNSREPFFCEEYLVPNFFVLFLFSKQCVLGGNATPSSGDVEKILASVGAEADGDKLGKLMSELNGKDIEEVIAAGSEKLASVPAGGAVAAAGGGSAPAAAAEEEKKEESEEESDDVSISTP